MKKSICNFVLALYLVSFLSAGIFAATTRAEVASCDEIPNSHQDGSNCVCDAYFKAVSGSCVPLPDSEACPMANTHREGDQCYCNEGLKFYAGKCMGPETFCALHHATFSAAINDCKCNKGYVENDAAQDCTPIVEGSDSSASSDSSTSQDQPVAPPSEPSTDFPDLKKPSTAKEEPVPPPSEPSTNFPDLKKPSTSLENNPQPDAPPPAPATPPSNTVMENPGGSDPAQVLVNLLEDPSKKVSNTPFVDAGLKGLSPEDLSMIQSQKDSIQQMSSDDSEVQFSATEDQKLNALKGVIMSEEAAAQKKYDEAVKKAEQDKILNNPSDKSTYDDLQRQKEALAKQIQNIQDANNVVYKQSIQIILNEQAGSNAMYYGDKKFNDAPKHDYMKESQGDPGMALLFANQSILGNKNLVNKVKDDIRKLNDQQRSLLKLPEKPVSDIEGKMKSLNPNWYKTK